MIESLLPWSFPTPVRVLSETTAAVDGHRVELVSYETLVHAETDVVWLAIARHPAIRGWVRIADKHQDSPSLWFRRSARTFEDRYDVHGESDEAARAAVPERLREHMLEKHTRGAIELRDGVFIYRPGIADEEVILDYMRGLLGALLPPAGYR